MESNGFKFENLTDKDGNPTGGTVEGIGIDIRWQDGPLNRCEMSNREQAIQEILDFISRDRLIMENPESFLSWLKEMRKTLTKKTMTELYRYTDKQCDLLHTRPSNSEMYGCFPAFSVAEHELLREFITQGDLYLELALKVKSMRLMGASREDV